MLSMLPLDLPKGCTCCSDPAMLQWHRVAHRLDPALAAHAMKEDGLRVEDGEDAFLDEELAIAAALSAAWVAAAAKAKPVILRVFDKAYSPGNFQMAVDEVTPIMDRVFDEAAADVTAAVRSSLLIGVGSHAGEVSAASAPLANALPIMSTPTAQAFEQGIIAAARYTTNRYFNTQVLPAITRSIDAFFNRLDAPNLAQIQLEIAAHFRTVPYWQLVANVAASRGYHYGMLRMAQNQGVIAYRIVAVIDSRTSLICRALNGREFLVAEAVNLMDALASDPDPLAAKTRTPWVKATAVEGKSSRDLAGMGVMLPPFHPLCRTTILPIFA